MPDGTGMEGLVFIEGAPHLKPKAQVERKMFFSPTKEKVLYGDDGVILEDGTKMTHEELEKEKFLENTVHKLIDNSYFFRGLKYATIMKFIAQGIISIVEIKPGVEIISEHDKNCDVFYVLLRGKLGIYIKHGKRKVKICDVKKISVIGEIGFINPEKRTATVTTGERSFLMRFDKRFMESLNPKDKDKIKDNLIIELSSKVIDLNFMLAETCDKLAGGNGGSTIVTKEIKKQIEDMVCHTIEGSSKKKVN